MLKKLKELSAACSLSIGIEGPDSGFGLLAVVDVPLIDCWN